jgi:hypothetical protein
MPTEDGLWGRSPLLPAARAPPAAGADPTTIGLLVADGPSSVALPPAPEGPACASLCARCCTAEPFLIGFSFGTHAARRRLGAVSLSKPLHLGPAWHHFCLNCTALTCVSSLVLTCATFVLCWCRLMCLDDVPQFLVELTDSNLPYYHPTVAMMDGRAIAVSSALALYLAQGMSAERVRLSPEV